MKDKNKEKGKTKQKTKQKTKNMKEKEKKIKREEIDITENENNIKREKTYKTLGKVFLYLSLIVFLMIIIVYINVRIYMNEKEKENQDLIKIYEEAEGKEKDEKLLKHSIKAMLIIPKEDIKELIYTNKGNVYSDLKKGIVEYNRYDKLSDADTNTTVILGHNSGLYTKKVFLKLENIHKGDTFYIQYNGSEYKYNIESRKEVYPTQEPPFTKEEGKNKVYLVTCYPYPINNKRLILEGILERKK